MKVRVIGKLDVMREQKVSWTVEIPHPVHHPLPLRLLVLILHFFIPLLFRGLKFQFQSLQTLFVAVLTHRGCFNQGPDLGRLRGILAHVLAVSIEEHAQTVGCHCQNAMTAHQGRKQIQASKASSQQTAAAQLARHGTFAPVHRVVVNFHLVVMLEK